MSWLFVRVLVLFLMAIYCFFGSYYFIVIDPVHYILSLVFSFGFLYYLWCAFKAYKDWKNPS